MSAEAFIVTDAHPISEHLIKDALLVPPCILAHKDQLKKTFHL